VAPHALIPLPAEVRIEPSDSFFVEEGTRIVVDPGDEDGLRIGEMLSELIGNTIETMPAVDTTVAEATSVIRLTRTGADPSLGPEGYLLDVGPTEVTVRAIEPEGLFYGVQTLRQLLPARMEYQAAFPSPLGSPVAQIRDMPRFGWRGAMLDVARHFLPAEDVMRFIDFMALHKLNVLHLHLSDDQGWRVEIEGWPRLTEYGGSTEVGGRSGGFYSAEDLEGIVAYAAERFIDVVPEIDMPGHTNAALASYPELNCDGVAPELYTGTSVGFSSLCPDLDVTYTFIDDVVRQIGAMVPSPWFHMGGDEVRELSEDEYADFVGRVQDIVRARGKRMVGWDEVALADIQDGALVQLWRPLWKGGDEALEAGAAEAATALKGGVDRALAAGAQVILSPADRVYLDLKYDSTTALGLTWAGTPDTRESYDWRVDELFADIPEASIAGVEAPLWSETVRGMSDVEFMAFPRLAGVAEIGWSAADSRSWDEYRLRLGEQAERWTALGINFYRSPLVPWREGSSN